MPLFFADLLEQGSLSDFAWPTSEHMINQEKSIFLNKVNFEWSDNNILPGYCLTTIEVFFSDYVSRKHSAIAGGNNSCCTRYDFVKDTKVAKVGVVIRPDWQNAITAIYFYGSDNSEISQQY